jgi:hypothetical protein
MRVLDRCLDIAGPDSSTVPGVAAAAAQARTDPDMHRAISVLLAVEGESEAAVLKHMRLIMTVATHADADHIRSIAELRDLESPAIQVFSSCQAASRAADASEPRTAVVLAGMLLAAVVVEKSSLGGGQCRQMRNRVVHGDVTAALSTWRGLYDHPA